MITCKRAPALTLSFFSSLSLAAAGCLHGPERDEMEDPPAEVIDVRPSSEVELDATVSIAVTQPVQLESESWPVTLRRSDGRAVPFGIELGAAGYEIRLLPAERWPSGERVAIAIEPGFTDAFGRPLLGTDVELAFETRREEELASTITIRWPAPGRAAPLNLRAIAAAVSPKLTEEEAPPRLVLTAIDGRHRAFADVDRTSIEGVVLARLPEYRGPCDPLCPATRYRIELEGEEATAAPGPRGEVLTATITDGAAPVVTSTVVTHRGDRVIVEVNANEPIILRGTVSRAGGDRRTLELPFVASTCVFVEATGALAPDADYLFELEGEDSAGNPLVPLVIAARTKPNIEAMITEVVPAPAHDWGDSDGLGMPFDDRPGQGTVSSADEWIELVNLSNVPIDLASAGLVLRVIDSSPAETAIDGAPALYFGDGGSRAAWWPGEALVVRVRGNIAQTGFILELASGTRLIDRVVVGDAPGAVMASGTPPDLDHEALSRDGEGRFRWCVPTPGDPLVSPSCL